MERFKEAKVEITVLNPISNSLFAPIFNSFSMITGAFDYIITIFKDIKVIDEVKSYSSIDLLFIMDISDSLLPHMNDIKV